MIGGESSLNYVGCKSLTTYGYLLYNFFVDQENLCVLISFKFRRTKIYLINNFSIQNFLLNKMYKFNYTISNGIAHQA